MAEVHLSNHGNRLQPILENYQDWFKTEDEAGAIEVLLSDLFLRLDELGLDETDMIDQAMVRAERIKERAPDA